MLKRVEPLSSGEAVAEIASLIEKETSSLRTDQITTLPSLAPLKTETRVEISTNADRMKETKVMAATLALMGEAKKNLTREKKS